MTKFWTTIWCNLITRIVVTTHRFYNAAAAATVRGVTACWDCYGKTGQPDTDNVYENDGLNGNRLSALGNVCTHIVLPKQTKEVAHNTRPHLIPRNQCPFSPLSDSLETDQNSHQHPDGVLTCHYHFGVTYHSTPNHCYSTPNLTTHYYTNSQSQLLLNSMSC